VLILNNYYLLRNSVILCLFFIITSTFPQSINSLDKRMIFEDFFKYFPSESSSYQGGSTSFFYCLPFNLKELSTRALNSNLKINKLGSLELYISDFGSEKFSKKNFGVSLSRKINRYLDLGLSFNRNLLKVKNYANISENHFGFAASINYKNVLITAYNYFKKDLFYENILYFQTKFNFDRKYALYVILKKETEFPLQRIFVISVQHFPIFVNFGIGQKPDCYSLGVGLIKSIFQIVYNYKEDLNLGKSQYFCFYIFL